MCKNWVRSLGQEDPLEKEMATHSSVLAWRNPWTQEPGGLQFTGSQRVRHGRLCFHFLLSCIGEGNGHPLQCSCLENPRDGGAWWAAVYGVAQSQTRLKWLSSSSMSIRSVMPSNHLILSFPSPPAFNLSQESICYHMFFLKSKNYPLALSKNIVVETQYLGYKIWIVICI